MGEHVAAIIPEFAPNGKETVTVEQVLTHTAGFPFAPLGYPKMLDREQRLAAFGRWRLDYPPGSRFQFHLTSAAWLVAEIVERRTGLAFADYLRDRIAVPLGLSSLELGVPVDRQAGSVAPMTATDRTSDEQEPDPWGPWYLSDPRVLAAGEPSHALVATAADVALYFQALEHSGLWKPEAVAEGTRIRLTDHPHGEQIYGGGSNRRTSMGLFVTVVEPGRGQQPAVHGLTRPLRQRRSRLPTRLPGPGDRPVLRLSEQRLPPRPTTTTPGAARHCSRTSRTSRRISRTSRARVRAVVTDPPNCASGTAAESRGRLARGRRPGCARRRTPVPAYAPFPPARPRSIPSRSRCRPRRAWLFTVPRGIPVCSAIWAWVRSS